MEFAGAFHHVINRGLERRTIFGDDSDYGRFLDLCGRLKERHKVEILAYCLMPNHFHLFVRNRLANLGRFMKDLNGEYTRGYNKRVRRVGPLFQGRYKAILIQGDAYALEVARYIHMNPVKAGLVEKAEGYRWSSFREYLGTGASGVADTAFLLGYFRGAVVERMRQFRRFTKGDNGGGYDPASAKAGVVSGEGPFIEWARKEKISRKKAAEIAGWKELRKPGEDVVKSLQKRIAELTEDRKLARKLLVYALRKSTPLSLREVAGKSGMASIFAVSQVVRRLNMGRKTDEGLKRLLNNLDAKLRSEQ